MSTRKPFELRSLGEMFRERDAVPESAVTAAYAAIGRSAHTARTTELALIADSADSAREETPEPEGAGYEIDDPARTLAFALPGRVIELELIPNGAKQFRARGMVVSRAGQPVPSGTFALRHNRGEAGGKLDACGGFVVDQVPAGPLSVRFITTSGVVAISDWFVC